MGPAYSVRKTVRQAIWGPAGGVHQLQLQPLSREVCAILTQILDRDGALLTETGLRNERLCGIGHDGAIATLGYAQTMDRGASGGSEALVELGGRVRESN